jgi:hypothetical protein
MGNFPYAKAKRSLCQIQKKKKKKKKLLEYISIYKYISMQIPLKFFCEAEYFPLLA